MAGVELLLEGKTALITGGSRGIGAETVRLFRAAGARVAFSYRQAAEQARALEEECGRQGPTDQGNEGTRDQGPRDPSASLSAGSGDQGPKVQGLGTGDALAAIGTGGGESLGSLLPGFRGRGISGSTGASGPQKPASRGRGEGSAAGAMFGEDWGGVTVRLSSRPETWGLGTAGSRGGLQGKPLGPARAPEVVRLELAEADLSQVPTSGLWDAEAVSERSRPSGDGDQGALCVGIEQELETPGDGRALVEKAVAALGRLDILVVNHGIWPADDASITEMSEEQWRRTLGVNLDAVFGLVQAAVGVMLRLGTEGLGTEGLGAEGLRDKGQAPKGTEAVGHIVLISSTAGQRGEAFHADYAASKGALISLTKSLSSELAWRGIRVNCVAPGWVETEMSAKTLEDPELGPWVRAGIPMGRAATPREIAGPVLFLCTPLAGFISGEVLNVNGGAVLMG